MMAPGRPLGEGLSCCAIGGQHMGLLITRQGVKSHKVSPSVTDREAAQIDPA